MHFIVATLCPLAFQRVSPLGIKMHKPQIHSEPVEYSCIRQSTCCRHLATPDDSMHVRRCVYPPAAHWQLCLHFGKKNLGPLSFDKLGTTSVPPFRPHSPPLTSYSSLIVMLGDMKPSLLRDRGGGQRQLQGETETITCLSPSTQ